MTMQADGMDLDVVTELTDGNPVHLRDYRAYLFQEANKCWRKMPVPPPCDFEDVIAVGCEAFVRASRAFNPRYGTKFLTYFGHTLIHAFGGMVEKSHRARQRGLLAEDRGEDGLDMIPSFDLCDIDPEELDVPPCARELVWELISPSDDFRIWEEASYQRIATTDRTQWKRVRRYFIERKDWPASRIGRAIKAIRKELL